MIYIRTTTGAMVKESAIQCYEWHKWADGNSYTTAILAFKGITLANTPNRADHDALVDWILSGIEHSDTPGSVIDIADFAKPAPRDWMTALLVSYDEDSEEDYFALQDVARKDGFEFACCAICGAPMESFDSPCAECVRTAKNERQRIKRQTGKWPMPKGMRI